MIETLRETCKKLLEDVTVDVIIGYGRTVPGGPVHAIFVTEPDDVSRLVWDEHCLPNLTVYLTRPEVRALGRPGIVLKGCDARSLVVLEQEGQVDRTAMRAIGVACDGVSGAATAKCAWCDVHMPPHTDEVIGTSGIAVADEAARYRDVQTFMNKSMEERMAYWKREFARCTKCYACRAVCPTCYCQCCIVDKNRPTCIETSAHLQGNFAWQIVRAFHQAGRCTGCGECTRVCPAGINLDLLNASLRSSAETQFHYRAGMDREMQPVIGSYSQKDHEEFIQ